MHAPEIFLEADDYVVAVTVSPGLGHGEAHAGGLAHESQLGELSEVFLVEFGGVLKFRFDGLFGESQVLGPVNVMVVKRSSALS